MAVKYGHDADAPTDWKEQLSRIDGVSAVTGNLPHRAQFTATAEAASKVKAQFSEAFHLEEIASRGID